MHFKVRSNEKEYLDSSSIATNDLYLNLAELNIINKQLGGYRASCNGLAAILKNKKTIRNLLDIGYGGGDFVKQLSKFANTKNVNLFFYGVDLKIDCLNYAEKNLSTIPNKKLICDDYRNISALLLSTIDVIHCSLFLHHLKDAEIINLFTFAKENNCIILANDLHRNWFAYYSIKFFTSLLSKSYLVKNDAPISVKRGFKRKELIALIEQAGFTNYSLTWNWAFRYIVIAYP